MTDIRKLGAEHSVDVDLLPAAPIVLDIGCRGFEFDFELLKVRPAAIIHAFDPDPSIQSPDEYRIIFHRCAITEKVTPTVRWQGEGDGAYICGAKGDPGYGWAATGDGKDYEVKNTTISEFMARLRITHFDLIKIDCEGSEFGMLENWPGPIAIQISVEFHDFIDRNRWNDAYFEKLFAGPLKDYKLALWGLTPLGPGPSYGHWDTLLVRK